MTRSIALALVLVASCKPKPETRTAPVASSAPVASTAPAASTAPVASTAPPPSATTSAPAVAVRDFSDEFAYGMFDAGPGDVARLGADRGFTRYENARFGFSVDVPKGLDAMPAPENGDGMQWRLGDKVAMSASGMINVPEVRELPCARSPSVTAHKETETTCWSTGVRGGYVFWERYLVSGDVLYSLRFQYVASVKTAMDPIVTRVNASWKP